VVIISHFTAALLSTPHHLQDGQVGNYRIGNIFERNSISQNLRMREKYQIKYHSKFVLHMRAKILLDVHNFFAKFFHPPTLDYFAKLYTVELQPLHGRQIMGENYDATKNKQ